MGSLQIPDAGEAATVWINEVMLKLKDSIEPSDMDQGIDSGLRAYFGQKLITKKTVVEFGLKAWVHISKQNQMLRRLKSKNDEVKSKVMRSMDEQI